MHHALAGATFKCSGIIYVPRSHLYTELEARASRHNLPITTRLPKLQQFTRVCILASTQRLLQACFTAVQREYNYCAKLDCLQGSRTGTLTCGRSSNAPSTQLK